MTTELSRRIRFVNLHGHSTFSFGDGHRTPAHHVERAAELGYSALALTEHGNVSSHFQLEKHALKAGIKPIFGLEAYTGAVDEEHRQQYKFHLTVLAATAEGYRNLNRVVTQSYLDAYYHPTVSGEYLSAHSSGLVILSGCTGSLLACTLIGGKGIPEREEGPDINGAWAVIERFRSHFGDNYFLEVQPFWELEKSCRMNPVYEKLSRETGVPLVVTHDIHYPRPEDAEMQAILHASHRGKHSIDDALRDWNYEVLMTFPESDRDLGEKLIKTGLSRSAAWEAIMNSERIAGMCNVTLPKAERLRYPISEEDRRPW
jgi:DNA polymerase-3 subunit alpha